MESLRAQVAQKDMFISELLDRIAIVECEVGGVCVVAVWCACMSATVHAPGGLGSSPGVAAPAVPLVFKIDWRPLHVPDLTVLFHLFLFLE